MNAVHNADAQSRGGFQEPTPVRFNINWVVENKDNIQIRSRDINAAIEAVVLDQGLIPVIGQVRSLTDEEAPQVWVGEDPESGGRAVDVRELVEVWTRVADWGGIEVVRDNLHEFYAARGGTLLANSVIRPLDQRGALGTEGSA